MKYSLDYFIDKYEGLDDDLITLSTEAIPLDAWEWCNREETAQLYKMVRPYGILLEANDGDEGYEDLGNSPKERVINFLAWIKNNERKFGT